MDLYIHLANVRLLAGHLLLLSENHDDFQGSHVAGSAYQRDVIATYHTTHA
jgi:hypothetical protein